MDLPDPVFRDLKTKAAREGVTLKELLKTFVEKGLYGKSTARETGARSPLPVFFEPTGETIPALTNAELEEIFTKEDFEGGP